MRNRNLAGGIISRTTLSGIGYGILLGSGYGALCIPLLGLLPNGVFQDMALTFGGYCFFLLAGAVMGAALGMAWGLFLGIAAGVAFVVISTLFPRIIATKEHWAARVVAIAMACLNSIMWTLIFATSGIAWWLSVGVPTILATWALWRVSNNVASWAWIQYHYGAAEPI